MPTPAQPPRVGISSCLLGERVRYDGRDKLQPLLLELLGPHVEWLAVCPEVEVGMGVPREPVRLEPEAAGGSPRMVGTASRRDWSGTMRSFASRRLANLAGAGLSGYVLKSRSPSCGLAVALFDPETGEPLAERVARGLFAAELIRLLPGLPIAEEETLATAEECAGFLSRVRSYQVGRRPSADPGRSGRRRGGRGRGLSGTTSELPD